MEPKLDAVILCDQVYVEPQTKKKTLLGVHDGFMPDSFPATLDFCVFVRATSLRIRTDIGVRLVQVSEDGYGEGVVIGNGTLTMEADPIRPAEGVLNLFGTRFSEPGEYWIRFYWGNKLIDQRIVIKQHKDGV